MIIAIFIIVVAGVLVAMNFKRFTNNYEEIKGNQKEEPGQKD